MDAGKHDRQMGADGMVSSSAQPGSQSVTRWMVMRLEPLIAISRQHTLARREQAERESARTL
jgi:hypothetical protein